MDTAKLEGLVQEAMERISVAMGTWGQKVYEDKWPDDLTVDTLIDDFRDHLDSEIS